MKTPSASALLSFALNLVLSLWLINNYFYDEPFRAYVNVTLSQVYPLLVLTLGLGGGSGLGYLLLRRRHPGQIRLGRTQKDWLARRGTLTPGLASPSASQGKALPSGPPPSQPSKHTAYAVPSLSAGSPVGTQRSSPSSSWSLPPKAGPAPSSLHRLESSPRFGEGRTLGEPTPTQAMNQPEVLGEPQRVSPPSPKFQGLDRPTTSFASGASETPGSGSAAQWRPEGTVGRERGVQSPVFPRPQQETSKVDSSRPPQPSSSTVQPPIPYLSKWQSPEAPRPPPWVNPVPKPEPYSPQQKWASPESRSPPPLRPSPPLGQPVPGQATNPRPPFTPTQGPPRPIAYPGFLRPLQPGSGPPAGPPRGDQVRPLQGTPAFQRPPQSPGPRVGVPQQDRPPADQRESTPMVPKERAEGSVSTTRPASTVEPTEQSPELKQTGELPATEMDWDTALDTILKTLKKDKVVEKP